MNAPTYDDQRISALLDGRLDGPERDELLAYLASADEAYLIAVDTVAILREVEEEEQSPSPLLPQTPTPPSLRSRVRRYSPSRWLRHSIGGILMGNAGSADQARRVPETGWQSLLRDHEAKYRIAEFAGGLLSAGQVAEILKIPLARVTVLVQSNDLLVVPLPDGKVGFPRRQFFTDDRVREGVWEVAQAGAHVDPWMLLSILIDDVEDGSGGLLLERLGEPEVLADVLNRLATYGRHGAA